mmetsp:Transcript_20627/g.38598  ORF Transcript_20627/g.38598 Transcript_20627/m.38598 type:complete len:191 (-) Transcript_20627:237-809(-)
MKSTKISSKAASLWILSLATSFYYTNAAFLNPVTNPYSELKSCKNYEMFAGDTFETSCTDYCSPNQTEVFDYGSSDDDPRYVIRNTVCRCFEQGAGANKSFECWTKAQVWDKETPIMKCSDTALNITSQIACEEFCKTIDPIAYGFVTQRGKSRCSCGQDVLVCDDIGGATGLATATAFTLLLGTLAMVW